MYVILQTFISSHYVKSIAYMKYEVFYDEGSNLPNKKCIQGQFIQLEMLFSYFSMDKNLEVPEHDKRILELLALKHAKLHEDEVRASISHKQWAEDRENEVKVCSAMNVQVYQACKFES